MELGYKVVDDYMRQGQAAARRMGDQPPGDLPLGRDLTDLTTRWFEYTTRMAEIWFQLMGMTGAGPIFDPRGSPTAARPAGSPPTTAASASIPDRVSVTIECSRPIEVAVDLRPTTQSGNLVAHRLRTVDPDAPPIGEVGVVRDGAQGFTVRVCVGEDQPAGTYSGLVVDEATNLPVGSIRVCVP